MADVPTTLASRAEGAPPALRPSNVLALVLCLAVTATVYLPALRGELVYDDLLLVARNPFITELSHVPTAFTRGYWDFLEVENADKIGYWRPLTAIAMTLVWWVGGGPSTTAFHAFSLLTHLAATAMCFFLARRLTANGWVAGFAALFFGLHPTHVESVAWISALNDPLFGFFCLSSVHSFLCWRDRGSHGVPLLAPLAFALGLLAKELAAATVLILVALHIGRGGRSTKERPASLLRAYGPFAVVLVAYFAVRMVVFESPWAGFDRQTTHFGVGLGREWLLRAELMGGAVYLLAAPLELNLFRVFRPHVPLGDPAILTALASIAAYAAALTWAWRARWKPGLFGLLLIPAGLVPVMISIQSLGRFPLSDRFLYVPVFGFALCLCLLLRRLPRPAAWGCALFIAGAYGLKTHDRIGVWHDEESLFERTAQQSPRSVYAHWGLGRVYLEKARHTASREDLDQAFAAFERASKLLVEAKASAPGPGSPRSAWESDLMVTSQDFLQTNLGLAWCYIFLAQLDPQEGYATPIAILDELIRRVSEIEQKVHDARQEGIVVLSENLELEKLYTALGVAQRFAGRPEEATESFQRALALQPNYVEAHTNYGRLLFEEGRFAQARARFDKALELQPGGYETKLLLARTLVEEHRDELAERYALELAERDPLDSEPLVILASLRLRRGDASDALTWLERATRADPQNAHAWYLKAKALIQRSAATEAIASFRNSIKWGPSFENNYDFGAYLLNAGALEEALPYLVTAYELAPPEHVGPLRQNLMHHPAHTADTLYRLGKVDMKRGEYDMAETFLGRTLELQADHAGALLLMSRLLKLRGRHDEALDMLKIAVSRMPNDFSTRLEYAFDLLERGRFEEARAQFVRARELGPPHDWAEEARADGRKQIDGVIARIDSGEARAEWEAEQAEGR